MPTRGKRPNTALRDLMKEAGWTYEGVAAAVQYVAAEAGEPLGTTKATVFQWAAGAHPSGSTVQYLSEAFSRRLRRPVTPAHLGLLTETDQEPAMIADNPVQVAAELNTPARRAFLAAAGFTVAALAVPLGYDHDPVARSLAAGRPGARIGMAEVQVARQVNDVFRGADERLGGGHGLSTVTTYLADTIAPMLGARFPSETVRREAFGAAAETAYIAAFKYHDLGKEGAAQRYYLLGFQLACESDPWGHAAWMMRALAHQALALKQPHHCVALTDASLTRGSGRVDARTEALLRVTRARALAAVGESAPAARALLAAQDALMRDLDDKQPSYSTVLGPPAGAVASHTARALTEMGDHRAAEAEHRAALARRNPQAFPRIQALTYADLGDCLAGQGRADEAIGAWSRTLDLTPGVASDRVRKALISARTKLATYNRRGVPGARELDRRIRDALQT